MNYLDPEAEAIAAAKALYEGGFLRPRQLLLLLLSIAGSFGNEGRLSVVSELDGTAKAIERKLEE